MKNPFTTLLTARHWPDLFYRTSFQVVFYRQIFVELLPLDARVLRSRRRVCELVWCFCFSLSFAQLCYFLRNRIHNLPPNFCCQKEVLILNLARAIHNIRSLSCALSSLLINPNERRKREWGCYLLKKAIARDPLFGALYLARSLLNNAL